MAKFKFGFTGTAPDYYFWQIYGSNSAGQPIKLDGSWATPQTSFYYDASGPVIGGAYTYTPGSPPANVSFTPTCNRYYTAVLCLKSACGATTVCSSNYTMQVICNDPSFNFAVTSYAGYFKVAATPVDLNGNSYAGFNYCWKLKGFNDPGRTSQQFIFDECGWACRWNNYPSTDVFKGFDHIANPTYTGGAPASPDLTPSTVPEGKFKYYYPYRITRATARNGCGWSSEAGYDITGYPPGSVYDGEVLKEAKFIMTSEDDPNFKYTVITGVEANTRVGNLFSVYPNPSNGIFTIELATEEKATFEVYDMTGKLIKGAQLTKEDRYVLDLSGFAKGVYLIKMNGQEQQIEKIIIE